MVKDMDNHYKSESLFQLIFIVRSYVVLLYRRFTFPQIGITFPEKKKMTFPEKKVYVSANKYLTFTEKE